MNILVIQKTRFYLLEVMIGDQGTTRNNAFSNVSKKITIHKK